MAYVSSPCLNTGPQVPIGTSFLSSSLHTLTQFTHIHTQSHSLTHTLKQAHTHSLRHTLTHKLTLSFTHIYTHNTVTHTFTRVHTQSHTHFHTLAHKLIHTLSLSHTLLLSYTLTGLLSPPHTHTPGSLLLLPPPPLFCTPLQDPLCEVIGFLPLLACNENVIYSRPPPGRGQAPIQPPSPEL